MPAEVLKKLHSKYERYVSPFAMLIGFAWDNLTLRRVDLWIDNLILLGYLVIAISVIALINAYEAGKLRNRISEELSDLLGAPLQFAFGGLFSAFVVFYSRSAAFITSWPFLLFLAFLLVGNELFRRRYLRFTFHMSIFYIALFSYSILIVPILFGLLGVKVFLISALASLLVMILVILFLSYVIRIRFQQSRRALFISVASIYLLFHILYFANMIPPIPLSLKEGGIYHFVDRTDTGGYLLRYEPSPHSLFLGGYNPVFHRIGNEPVYSYSSVFAPTNLTAKIIHRWSYYSEKEGEWVISDNLQFPITGGRDGGYRGFSVKKNIMPGMWRVDVMTETGQLLGRMKFEVVESVEVSQLKTVVK